MLIVAALASLVAVAAGQPAAVADELALRRVMLSTGGVGYFEFEAVVTGDAVLSLDVRLDQVDDILKSIVVYDHRGTIGEISLPGREPLREVFRELPFGPDALSDPVALLNALRGAEVRAVGVREVAGRIVSVTPESAQLPEGGTVTWNRVSVMTADGLRQLILEDTDTLQFVDPELRGQVNTALAAMAEHNARDRRRLEIRLSGPGERTVRVGYVTEVPLWKAAYRLTIAADADADSADLQGWAVVENLSGEHWRDIELTVVSGNPVTFRQALYDAYYVDRPEVPVEVLGRVLPPVDAGATEIAGAASIGRAAEMPMPSGPMRLGIVGELGLVADMTENAAAPQPAPPPLARMTAAASSESTTQVAFRFPMPVNVTGGHSLLLPIISRAVPAERLSLYQPATDPRHPLASIELTNTGVSGLPPGVITLYERASQGGDVSFVGDARLGPLPAGERRLVSFAVDQKVGVDREASDVQTTAGAKIVDGVLEVTVTDRRSSTYTITGAAREDRLVVLEHPRVPGWTLVEPADDRGSIERTANQYRLRRAVSAGETAIVTIAEERPVAQRVQLSSLTAAQIAYYAAAREISPAVRQAIARLAEFQAAVVDSEAALKTMEADLDSIVQDQRRIRENIRSVPQDSDLYQRYLGKLGEQEDRIDALRTDIAATANANESARQALLDYVRDLNI